MPTPAKPASKKPVEAAKPNPVRRHLKLDSSNIAAVGYDAGEKLLEIVFQDNPAEVYTYRDVPSTTFLELINAESVGSYFAKTIRANPKLYPWTKRKAA